MVTPWPSPLGLQMRSWYEWNPRFPHVEKSMGPGAGLPRAPFPPAPRWAERVPGPRLNAEAGGDGAGFQPRPPNHPYQSSRGPPCGHFQEQPRTWCTSPNAGGCDPGPPHTSGPLSDPKALKRRPTVSIPLSSKPKYFREIRGLLAPPGKTWWRTKLPKVPAQGPFSQASLRESSLRGHNVFFLTERVKAL